MISALNNYNTLKLLDKIIELNDQYNKRVKTHVLNDFLYRLVELRKPDNVEGKQVHIKYRQYKIRYITQVSSRPPTFALFSNRDTISDNYLKYMLLST